MLAEVGDEVLDTRVVHFLNKTGALGSIVVVFGDDNDVRVVGDEVFYGDVALSDGSDCGYFGEFGVGFF